MKVNFKINTLRGIFLCLQGNKFSPLDALSAVFKQVPGAKECIKAINYAYNPSKIVLDIGKKGLSMGLSAGSL